MYWFESILMGIVSGVVASVLFYHILKWVKPRIDVSDVVCVEPQSDGTCLYRVKVVNLSKLTLTKISYSMQYVEIGQDKINTIRSIAPNKTKLEVMQQYSKKDPEYNYAVRITYKIPQSEFPMKKNTKLIFTFCTDHPFSGSTTCVVREYDAECIHCGVFEKGKSMEYTQRRETCLANCEYKSFCETSKNKK